MNSPPAKAKPKDHRDPLSGAPGAHPVGTAVGAAAGGAWGAALGTSFGPLGATVGAVAGAVVGGIAGKAAAEGFDPTGEDAYWRHQYRHEPYADAGRAYEDYAVAYRVGYLARQKYPGRAFEDIEAELAADFERERDSQNALTWERARPAARAAWARLEPKT
jgi:hypothetical protein